MVKRWSYLLVVVFVDPVDSATNTDRPLDTHDLSQGLLVVQWRSRGKHSGGDRSGTTRRLKLTVIYLPPEIFPSAKESILFYIGCPHHFTGGVTLPYQKFEQAWCLVSSSQLPLSPCSMSIAQACRSRRNTVFGTDGQNIPKSATSGSVSSIIQKPRIIRQWTLL